MSEPNKPTEAEEIIAESQKVRDPSSSAETTSLLKESSDATQVQSADAILIQDNDSTSDEENIRKIRDVIFVGTKPIMTYVTATLTQLSTQPVVTIKARGQRITQAVDVSQMIVKRMNTVGYMIKDVRIASDSLLSQDGKTRNVSTIEIDITKA